MLNVVKFEPFTHIVEPCVGAVLLIALIDGVAQARPGANAAMKRTILRISLPVAVKRVALRRSQSPFIDTEFVQVA